VDGIVQLRQDSAGGAHLDQLGVVAQLLADGLDAAVHPVAEPELAVALAELGHPGQGE
jgi:hypothetical protein